MEGRYRRNFFMPFVFHTVQLKENKIQKKQTRTLTGAENLRTFTVLNMRKDCITQLVEGSI